MRQRSACSLRSAGRIEDGAREIELCQSRSFADARLLADALGNVDEVAEFIGRNAPEE
ncbi:hypothetical protein OHA63_20815 [Streptomyces anulatus]|uniref:hypothetical protein n=1 Tax=Streptomyces anulatus TaxID=1892 RepID=UPI002E33D08A|nr:hypothetical protein [Streptomyces anulatus]